MDLIPEIKVTVYREGEAEPSLPVEEAAAKPEEKKPVESARKQLLRLSKPDFSTQSQSQPSPVQPCRRNR